MSTIKQQFTLGFKDTTTRARSGNQVTPDELARRVLAYVELNPGLVLIHAFSSGRFVVKFQASRDKSPKESTKRDLFDYE